jgi:RNA methyltransferase, TrmH family
LVEGIAPVWQAVDHAEVETLIVARDVLRSDDATALVERAGSNGVSVVDLTREAFESLADRDNPSGLAAIVATTRRTLADVKVERDSLFAILEDVAGPGNLGAIVRTADAASALVIVVGLSTDPWHPACVKASMGTVFSSPVVVEERIEDAIAWCRANDVTVVTTSARASAEHWAVTYELPAAIIMGSERRGLSPEILALGNVDVRIPMSGDASSLNLAVAAGILLYEARRTRS